MNDVLKYGKKLFTASVVGVTVAWSMGLAALVPTAAYTQSSECPELEAGDLFKSTDSTAVYYLTAQMERAYFPNQDVFFSWNLSFSNVKTVAGNCLFSYQVATPAGINYRPGSRLVKLEGAPTVFAISPGNKLVEVTGESVTALYGTNWSAALRDVSPFHLPNYTNTQTVWSQSKPHDGQFVKKAGETTVYWVKDGMLHRVDGTNVPDVREVSASTFAMLSMAAGSVTLSTAFENPTQVDGSAPAPTTGALTVMLASNTAASKVVPMGAQGVDYLAFTVKAGSSAGTLEQVTVKRAGIGNRSDFDKIYLYHDGVRVDNGRTLNTEDEVTFNVNKTIAANTTETFWVKADMKLDAGGATSGDQNFLEITTASDVEATGTVGGSFPVRGNSITLGAQDIGTITVTGQGSNTTAKIGQNNVIVSEFDVEASATDDVEVTGITLKQKGTAPASVLSNVKLMKGGALIAEGVVSGDWVKFTFTTKVTIEEGDTERFKVYADLAIADTNDTVELVLDEKADVMAYSVDFPGSLAGVTNSYTTTQSLAVTLQGGKINVDFDGTNEDVRVDQNDVVFGTFTILATAEDLDVDEMKFELIRPNSAVCLEDLRLREKNGKGSYSLDFDSACSTGTAVATTTAENLILSQGVTYEFEVVGDIANTAAEGDAYYFSWAAEDVDAEGVSSDNAVVTNDFSTASLTGPTMTVSPSSLTVRTSALSDESVVAGSTGVLVFRGTLEAGNTSDVTVTSLEVTEGANDSDLWQDLVDDMKLYIAPVGEAVDVTTDFVANDSDVEDEQALFTGFSHVVKAGSANRVNFEVRANITDGSATGDIEVEVSDVDAEDEDGEEVTAENASGTAIPSAVVTSDRVLTVSGAGTLTAVIDTNYTGLRNDHYVLAGTNKHLAGRMRLSAQKEGVELNDLSVFVDSSFATATVENTFETLNVYSDAAMTDLLSSVQLTKGYVVLEDIDYVVPADQTKYLYLGVDVNSIGTGDNGTASSTSITLALEDDNSTATGDSSSDSISPTVTETAGKTITSLGSQITNVATSFAGGSLAGGEQTFFTFAVTADSGANTDANGDSLSAYLTRLNLQLATDVGTASSENVSGIKICRVSTGSCVDLNTVGTLSNSTTTVALQTSSDGFVDVTDFTNADDERVNSGETVLYELRATFSNTTDHYAQGSVQDVNSSGIVWGYDGTANLESGLDITFTDLKKMEPRPSGYPDITGSALN